MGCWTETQLLFGQIFGHLSIVHFKAVSRLIILTKRFRYQLNHMSSAFGLIVGDISEAQLMER